MDIPPCSGSKDPQASDLLSLNCSKLFSRGLDTEAHRAYKSCHKGPSIPKRRKTIFCLQKATSGYKLRNRPLHNFRIQCGNSYEKRFKVLNKNLVNSYTDPDEIKNRHFNGTSLAIQSGK